MVHAVIASSPDVLCKMILPASRISAHFTALFYFVSLLLRLFVALPVGLPPTVCGFHTFAPVA